MLNFDGADEGELDAALKASMQTFAQEANPATN